MTQCEQLLFIEHILLWASHDAKLCTASCPSLTPRAPGTLATPPVLQAKFDKADEDVRHLETKGVDNEMLFIYRCYRQVTVGDINSDKLRCWTSRARPSRIPRMSWKEDAMNAYTLQIQELGVEQLKTLLRFNQPVSGKANIQIQKVYQILWVVFQDFIIGYGYWFSLK